LLEEANAMSSLRSVPVRLRPIALLLSLGLFPAGCLVGGQAASAPQERDDRLLAELRRQEKWAGEAAAGRASREELKAAQAGDLDAQADLRQRFRKLLRAAERATWVREATPAALQGRSDAEKAERIASFDKAARLRKDAWDAADEIAQTLCAIDGPSPLSLADLRRGLSTVRAAQQAEKRIAKLPPVQLTARAAPPTGGKTAEPAPSAGKTEPAPSAGKTESAPADAKTGTKAAAGDAKEVRLAAAPPPSPKPFIEAAALLLEKHPAEADLLRSFKPDLAEEATQIRAALADLRARRPPETDSSAEGTPAAPTAGAGAAARSSTAEESQEPDAPASGETEDSAAEGGKQGAGAQRRIDIKGEARAILRRRGPPRSILLRDDGTFVLRYDGPLRCASPPCPPTEDFHFSADGERLREAPAKAKAPTPAQQR
jgi:hypothetical protein